MVPELQTVLAYLQQHWQVVRLRANSIGAYFSMLAFAGATIEKALFVSPIVEVTAHEGARPTHAVWQGRVYHRGGAVVQDGERYEDFEAATGYGTGPGLCGWNCRHNFYPFYPGISVRNYTDERLAELDARNIPYGGGLYTQYEIAQTQRVQERSGRWNAGCAGSSCLLR